jgi:predicted DNA-binding transcriptional regulator AlpA
LLQDKATEGAVPPLALDARGCAKLFGVSERHWRGMAAAGLVPRAVRLGAAVRWRVEDLRHWLERGCPGRDAFERSAERAIPRDFDPSRRRTLARGESSQEGSGGV